MAPAEWVEHRRDEDGELIGYLVPKGAEGDLVVPVTVFGYPLGEAMDADAAQRMLDAEGLSYLADRWLLSLQGRDEPISVQIVEINPQRMRVKNVDFGYEGDYGEMFTLPVPAQGRLRRG